MFRFTIRDLLCLPVAVALATVIAHETPATAQETQPLTQISVKAFGRENVIGYLGQPLGTVVRVTGICVDGDTTQRKADLGKTLLQVQAVDGRALEPPIMFVFERVAKGVSKAQFGQPFDYLAHEWGSFDGVVQLAGEPSVASDGFYYRREITIHRDNSARK